MDTPQGRARERGLGIDRQPGDPEVGDHRATIGRQQDVARLDVAMDDAADVGDREAACDIETDPGGLPWCESAAALEAGGEVLALDELHDEVWLVTVGAGVQARDDVGVAQHRRGEGLAAEPLGEIRVATDLGPKELDGDGAVQAKVGRAMDRGHPATPDDRSQPVAIAHDAR